MVSMIGARRGVAGNNNHIRRRGNKSQTENNSEGEEPREEEQSSHETVRVKKRGDLLWKTDLTHSRSSDMSNLNFNTKY